MGRSEVMGINRPVRLYFTNLPRILAAVWEIYEQHVLHLIYVFGICGTGFTGWGEVCNTCRRKDTLGNIYLEI